MTALLILFLIPFVAALSAVNQRVAFITSLLPLAFLIVGGSMWHGLVVDYPWLPSLGIRFHLEVDQLSLIFLYIVAVITPIGILAKRADRAFYGLILLLQGLLIGFFTSKDLIFFTFFFEAILLPLYFLISRWGGQKREMASFKFIIYMIAGSTLMVLGALALYFTAGTFDIDLLAKIAEKAPYAPVIGAIFLLAFAVKTPLFPFHGWLRDSYSEAPIGGTILLSAVLSKAGIYGIIRISLGLFPNLMHEASPFLLILAIIGVLYGALSAWAQTDFKKLIAYSSFSHVNFILAGLFVWNEMARGGAILQVINHAVTITGLFLVAGWLEARLGTTEYGKEQGLTAYMPKLAWLTLFFTLSAVALPGLNNFISEVMLLYGVFQHSIWMSAILGLTVILSVVYMLRFFHSVYFNAPSPFNSNWTDIRVKEMCIAAPLVLLILWLGIYPAPTLREVVPASKLPNQIKAK